MSEFSYQVLVLDDDSDMRFALNRMFTRCGCTVTEASCGEDAVEVLKSKKIDLLLSDMRMPGKIGGEQIMAFSCENFPETRVVLMSCAMSNEDRKQLISDGASECLQKPFFKQECKDLLCRLFSSNSKAA